MKMPPHEIREAIEHHCRALSSKACHADGLIEEYSNKTIINYQAESILFLLFRSSAIAKSASAVGLLNLSVGLAILGRALLEDFITAYWISLSECNAKKYLSLADTDVRKLIRRNVKDGFAEVIRNADKEDVSELIMSSQMMNEKHDYKSVENRARESGLYKIYAIFYTSFSLFSHGHDIALPRKDNSIEPVLYFLQAINAIMKANMLIARALLESNQVISLGVIGKTLGFNVASGNT